MRILTLVGSYRKHGNTDQMVGLVEEELRRISAERGTLLELETVYLGHQQIERQGLWGVGQCRLVSYDR